MLKVRSFCGLRFDPRKVPLSQALCPPYDVIAPELERRLRKVAENAIQVELPAGNKARRYRNAQHAWRLWLDRGVVIRDPEESFYIVEQKFTLGNARYCRKGVLVALGVDPASARYVMPHEKTLSKPKEDRTRLLEALQVNTSPIFGLFSDSSGAVRRILRKIVRRPAEVQGIDAQGVAHCLWRVHDGAEIVNFQEQFAAQRLLIADGHHRYEVARHYWEKTQRPGAEALLAYLCAEEDPGLVVLPTHRVLALAAPVRKNLHAVCVDRLMPDLAALEKALNRAQSPYAFGLYDGRFHLMLPARPNRGVPSGFGTDWLAQRILQGVDAQGLRYFHDGAQAVREARLSHAAAFLIKPFSVSAIGQAVQRAGLLPQKSTYFYPKIATGLVFRALADE